MKRTNIYLEEDQLRLLKHIAVEAGQSFTELVRQALQEFLDRYKKKTKRAPSKEEWNRRLEKLLARMQQRTRDFKSEEIEADITSASKEARHQKSHAARPR